MTGRVKRKILDTRSHQAHQAYRGLKGKIFLVTIFSLLFITLLQFRKSSGRWQGGLEAANNPRSSERRGAHNIGEGLGYGGRRVCRNTKSGPQDYLIDHVIDHAIDDTVDSSVDDWLDELIEKVWRVESGHRLDPPVGDGGEAVGPLQIHKCVIDDVNRHWQTSFSYADRRDLQKSKRIAKLYIAMWFDIHKQEIAARIYNGGPRGWQKKTTDVYWQKIQKQR